ncbi:MAG: hypothetical protein ABJN80_13935, partial [Luteolibacter sp.]
PENHMTAAEKLKTYSQNTGVDLDVDPLVTALAAAAAKPPSLASPASRISSPPSTSTRCQ